MRKFTVRVSDDLGREVDEMAEEQGVSKAELLREGFAVVIARRQLDGAIAAQAARIAALEQRVDHLEEEVSALTPFK